MAPAGMRARGGSSRGRGAQAAGAAAAAVALAAAAGAAAAGQAPLQQRKGVEAYLRAPWRGTSVPAEIGEFLADESAAAFWEYVGAPARVGSSDAECVEAATARAEALIPADLAPVLRLSLSMREYSPRLAAYRAAAEVLPGGAPGACCAAHVGEVVVTDASRLRSAISSAVPAPPTASAAKQLGQEFPSHAAPHAPVATLYAMPGTPCFAAFHGELSAAASAGEVRYVLRQHAGAECVAEHRAEGSCAMVGEGAEMRLGGYGVELAIKSMEYKAIDDKKIEEGAAGAGGGDGGDDLGVDVRGFNFARLIERSPEAEPALLDFRAWLLATAGDEASDGAALQVWDLKDLGLQASQRITSASSHPLRILQDVAQNFPALAPSLSRVRVAPELAAEVEANSAVAPGGLNLVAFNGVIQNLDTMDAYSLLSLARAEIRAHARMLTLGLTAADARRVLGLRPLEGGSNGEARLDFTGGGKGLVLMYNDIERDAEYRSWPADPRALLMPSYGLPKCRMNLITTVFALDPSTSAGAAPLGMMQYYASQGVGVRFGVILVSPEALEVVARVGVDAFDAGEESGAEFKLSDDDRALLNSSLSLRMIRAFLCLRKEVSKAAAWDFLFGLSARLLPAMEDPYDSDPLDTPETLDALADEHIRDLFATKLATKPEKAGQVDALYEGLATGDAYMLEAVRISAHAAKKGIADEPAMIVNGRVFPGEDAVEQLSAAISGEIRLLQQLVYYGEITSKTNVLKTILKLGSVQRFSLIVSSGDEDPTVAPLDEVFDPASLPKEVRFVRADGLGEESTAPVTHLVVLYADEAGQGEELARAALLHAKRGGSSSRLGFLVNPPAGADVRASSQMLEAVGAPVDASEASLVEHARICAALGIGPGEMALVSNAKVYAVPPGASVYPEDLASIESSAREAFGDTVAAMHDASVDGGASAELRSHRLMLAAALTMRRQQEQPEAGQDINLDVLSGESVLIEENAAAGARGGGESARAPVLDVRAVLNPLSKEAQKLAPLLMWLREALPPQSLGLRVYLNPKSSITDLPLKSFYRFAAPSGLSFDPEGALLAGPTVSFVGLPESRTLTMNMDVPERWLVEPVLAAHDLDNLRLESLPEGVSTVQVGFELEALVVTGSCMNQGSRKDFYPRGLQLVLGTEPKPSDTIVMQNLGYFQLKAPMPGSWALSLAPGRSAELYQLDASATHFSKTTDGSAYDVSRGLDLAGISDDADGTDSLLLTVDSFQPDFVYLGVQRRAGKETEPLLLADGDGQGGEGLGLAAASMLSSWFGRDKAGKQVAGAGGDDNDKINIFTVCSGHLYERFMRIMILSVLQHTDTPVKFWFIKNYLSPGFQQTIPFMAKELGFEYEMITYKWPTFLNKQTEKMRLIWAYKILFLDVLFPVNLKRVIFVDADQIVRTDMKELMEMDLQGAVYGYTPFCDNNEEMEGFRFWKQGFWQTHLQNKPYHISALYVIDLERFRATGAGDMLRATYDQLSKDPHSLANLDQDLPNYMQHQVPIFSLPQEWLWCESWCGNATKAAAKTIDLCNNPMTKEPKLVGARRIVSEWGDYDDRQRDIIERAETELRAGAAAS